MTIAKSTGLIKLSERVSPSHGRFLRKLESANSSRGHRLTGLISELCTPGPRRTVRERPSPSNGEPRSNYVGETRAPLFYVSSVAGNGYLYAGSFRDARRLYGVAGIHRAGIIIAGRYYCRGNPGRRRRYFNGNISLLYISSAIRRDIDYPARLRARRSMRIRYGNLVIFQTLTFPLPSAESNITTRDPRWMESRPRNGSYLIRRSLPIHVDGSSRNGDEHGRSNQPPELPPAPALSDAKFSIVK